MVAPDLLVLRRRSRAAISLGRKGLEFTYLIVIAMLRVVIIAVLRPRFLNANDCTRRLYKTLQIAKTDCFVKPCLEAADIGGRGFARLALKYRASYYK
jgi:hypothetical protein